MWLGSVCVCVASNFTTPAVASAANYLFTVLFLLLLKFASSSSQKNLTRCCSSSRGLSTTPRARRSSRETPLSSSPRDTRSTCWAIASRFSARHRRGCEQDPSDGACEEEKTDDDHDDDDDGEDDDDDDDDEDED